MYVDVNVCICMLKLHVDMTFMLYFSFMRLYSTIFPRSVTEFSYRYNDPDKALIYIAFEVG